MKSYKDESDSVFIIGPEGSGKTVFATMLCHFIQKNSHLGIRSLESNIQTKKHLHKELSRLEKGNWPTSTKGGELVSLSWSWEIKETLLNIDLVDVSGQDVRRELSDESVTDLKIIESIQKASIVFLAIDLQGHYDEISEEKKIENAWIAENILKKMRPEQSLYVIVTKADLLHRFLKNDEDYHDKEILLNMIENLMPEFNLQGAFSLLEKDNCKFFAISAVETVSLDDEYQSRIPKVPLQSKGFDELIKSIVDFVLVKSEKEKYDLAIAKIKENTSRIIKKGMPYVKKISLIAGAIVVLFFIGGQVRSWVNSQIEKHKTDAKTLRDETQAKIENLNKQTEANIQAKKVETQAKIDAEKAKIEENIKAQAEQNRIIKDNLDNETENKKRLAQEQFDNALVDCNWGHHDKGGNLICPTCNGEGDMNDSIILPDTICKKCNRKGVIPCGDCKGSGKIKRKNLRKF